MKNKKILSEQEKFWKGKFGDTYISRNRNKSIISSNKKLFLKINKYIKNSKSLIEFGSNIGLNLIALQKINKKLNLTGIDINKEATKILMKNNKINVINDSILNINLSLRYDITFIKGVLIHINPKDLNKVYEKLYTYSKKYIYIAEYYNPTPLKISYRGHKNKLFKRDFAGEILDKYKNLKLVDYGFAYHRDIYPQDDLTWFLLKKS
mgnify:CR=1 FL=1